MRLILHQKNILELLLKKLPLVIHYYDVGYGALQPGDIVTIHGSYVQEVVTGNDAIIESPIDFEALVDVASTIILPANPLRKYLAITNNGEHFIYLNLGDTATLNKGIYLTPAGSFDLDKPYYGARSAIAVNDISSVSGVECS